MKKSCKNNCFIKRGDWMRQKYIIKKDDANSTLVIREYAELDKEIMSFMGEQEYSREDIIRAVAGPGDELINVLRNNEFYPPQVIAGKIAEKITEIYDIGIDEAVEILLDDADFLAKDEPEEQPAIPEIEEHDVDDDVDDLLDASLDDGLVDSKDIGSKNTTIKIADAETLDGDIEFAPEQ